jgi:hypothetical protein
MVTVPAVEDPAMAFTPVTSPTFTPAIRTGEGMCSSVLAVKVALSTNGLAVHGS